MARRLLILWAAILASCAGNTGRDPMLVSAEQRERLKPQLFPAGGTFYGSLTVQVLNYREGLEISDGTTTAALSNPAISVGATRTITIRDKTDASLASSETYTVVSAIPPVIAQPPGGEYSGTVLVTASTEVINARIEYSLGAEFSNYDPETGIALMQSSEVSLRACIAETCGPLKKFSYTIASKPVVEQPTTTADNARILASLAQSDYKQVTLSGLAARMDEAKLRVIADGSLMSDPALRSRFLAQHNDKAAAAACTTIARYLYVLARRMSESRLSYPVLPDFAGYYIRHIRAGDIVQDSEGSFVWIMNGANLVTPYLAAEQLNAFEYHRSSSYPTDFSLLEPIYVSKPAATLLRDGPGATVSTHTFAAVRTESGFIMLDTYFSPWNSVEARASAGQAWPYAYRFGPAGSRYLHYVYGY